MKKTHQIKTVIENIQKTLKIQQLGNNILIKLLKGLKRLLTREGVEMASQHMERCLDTCHGEVCIKTTTSPASHLGEGPGPGHGRRTPARSEQQLVAGQHGGSVRNQTRSPRLTQHRPLGVYSKELKTCPHRELHTDVTCIATSFVMAKTWKHPRCPSVGE